MNDTNSDQSSYIVIGASGGIGSEVARRLVATGSKVLLASRASGRLTDLGQELASPICEIDASETKQVADCFKQAEEAFGPLTGVVNCVGSLLLKPAHLTSDEEWDHTIATNLKSAFATVRAAGRALRRNGGSVVLVSSAAAQLGFANHEAIAAAKAGVIGLMRSAAATYANNGIRFNAVAPGLVQTPLTESIWSKEASAKASEEMHALGKLGEAKDVASMICWLLDPMNQWITGEVITIDGGLSNVRPTVRRKPS